MRKFLASVGNAKLLGKRNGVFQHIADVRTLTESTLSFSNTMEEVRAGQGAQLYGRFGHDSGMTVNITDAMFDINYIALQVGAELNAAGLEASGLFNESFDNVGETITLSKKPTNLGTACGLDKCFVWIKEKGCDKDSAYTAVAITAGETAVPAGEFKGKNICVEYFINKPGNNALQVSSNFIPAELVLILTTQLFAGDASAPETGKAVGSITVKIPRFQLDGTFDLSMAMSSAATISLQGTALAVDDGGCEGKGVYAEIVEIIDGVDILTNLKDVIIDPETAKAGGTPDVYGLFINGSVSKLGSEDYAIFNGTDFKETPDAALAEGVNTIVVFSGELPKTGTIALQDKEKGYYAEAITIA